MLARIHKNRLLPIVSSPRAIISSASFSSSSLSFSVAGTRPNSSVTQFAPMARLPSQQGRQVHATSTSYVNHAAPVYVPSVSQRVPSRWNKHLYERKVLR